MHAPGYSIICLNPTTCYFFLSKNQLIYWWLCWNPSPVLHVEWSANRPCCSMSGPLNCHPLHITFSCNSPCILNRTEWGQRGTTNWTWTWWLLFPSCSIEYLSHFAVVIVVDRMRVLFAIGVHGIRNSIILFVCRWCRSAFMPFLSDNWMRCT